LRGVKTVGIRELKNRLSEYVREVRLGERVLVSDRGLIVAELREANAGPNEGVPSGLAALARDGQVTLASIDSPPSYPKLRRVAAGLSARHILNAGRGAR
jgi:prevent-host-death family protein